MSQQPKKSTKDWGVFLLLATSFFLIAVMLFVNFAGLRVVTPARIEDCTARLEVLKGDLEYAQNRNATEEEINSIKGNITYYTNRISMLENRETLYLASMAFLACLLALIAFVQKMKPPVVKKVSLTGDVTGYSYYRHLSAPLCGIFILLGVGVTYRSIFSWEVFDLLTLIAAVTVGAVAFFVYRRSPYIAARLSTRKVKNTGITYGDILFLLPAVGILLLLAVNFLFGVTVNGAKLWLNVFGVVLQPSEFIKVLLAVLFASAYGKMWRAAVAFFVGGVTIAGMLALRDMGTAMVIFAMVVIMLFLLLDNKMTFSFSEHKPLLILVLILAICAFFVALSVIPYARERFMSFGSAMENTQQSQQASILKALVFGGFGGLGLENSSYILNIFAIQNDMALAGMTAVFGYGMLLLVLLCYALLIIVPLRKYVVYREFYFVSAQISVIMVVQVLLNALGSVDMLPFTGIVAPFISDGGSSLVSFCALMGILLATLYPVIKPLEVDN